jgi:hypothetical protein
MFPGYRLPTWDDVAAAAADVGIFHIELAQDDDPPIEDVA